MKIIGAHSGISVGPDGATHQALEDVAIMRALPNMIVICPADSIEARKATLAAAFYDSPVYIRLGREKSAVFTAENASFEIGKAIVIREGKDATIIGCGSLLYNAVLAAEELSNDGIDVEVINCHTVKPLDAETILISIKKTGAVVSVEEHQIMGGLGSAVAETLAQNFPAPQEFIGVRDRFGESGEADELIEALGMGVKDIKKAILKVIKRKI